MGRLDIQSSRRRQQWKTSATFKEKADFTEKADVAKLGYKNHPNKDWHCFFTFSGVLYVLLSWK